MTTIGVTTTTGDVTLTAATVDSITFSRGSGEDPLSVDGVSYAPNNFGETNNSYKGFRIVNNDDVDVIYYTVAYNNNPIATPVVGAAGTYRLNPGITDQWITHPMDPDSIKVKIISAGTPTYNVEAW